MLTNFTTLEQAVQKAGFSHTNIKKLDKLASWLISFAKPEWK